MTGFDTALGVVRVVVAAIACCFAVFCFIDWLVRTRKVNVFGALARFRGRGSTPFSSQSSGG